MKTFAALAFALLIALAGCATAPISNLPTVDVSRMENGKVLSAAEITTAVKGRQMTVEVQRANGSRLKTSYSFETDGTINGAYFNETDKGTWRVDQEKNELCIAFSRWGSGCTVVAVRNGKLYMYRRDNGTQYVQQ